MDKFLLKLPADKPADKPADEPAEKPAESSSDEDHEEVKRKRYYKQKFTNEWLREDSFKSWLGRNPRAPEEPYCTICVKSIKGGITHIHRHANSEMHKKNIKTAEKTPSVLKFYDKKKEDKLSLRIKAAELKLVGFIAEHNLAFSILDHLPQLISSICPDSEVAKKIKCCRKKGTNICKGVMEKESMHNLSNILATTKFSLIIDESTDVATKKNLVMVVRFYNKITMKVCDKFLALLEVNEASAISIFTSISNFFQKYHIPKKNLIGFGADNASTMMGNKSGVRQRLLEFNPDLFVLGCTCHSLALCSNAACSKIPNSVEQLAKDIYCYFAHSSKRLEAFKEYQIFAEIEPHRLLRPAQTRWLSLQAVVDRIIEQWSALQLFFSNESLAENLEKAIPIMNALHNNVFKVYFLFLSYILNLVNKLNIEFQAESYRMHILISQIKTTYKTILRNFMKPAYIDHTELDNISFHPENYLELDNIYFGAQCEMLMLKNTISDGDLKSFKLKCLEFYIELCKEFKKRFGFNDPVLNFLHCLDPKVVTTSPESIIPIYMRFQSMFENIDPEQLSTEWRSLSSNEELLLHTDKSVEEFWAYVCGMKNALQGDMYPNLEIFIQALLALPHSSASAERIFSQINLIKTKNRNRLHTATCNALMHTKNIIGDNKCHNYEPSAHILSLHLNPEGSVNDQENLTF